MTAKRLTRKTTRTPRQLAELRRVRNKYQLEKPSLQQALDASGHREALPLGEVILLHELRMLLKKEREKQHLTLAQIGKRTGITQAALSRLETGKSANPTLDTMYRVAEALGKTIACTLKDSSR